MFATAFVVTRWTHYESASPEGISPADYAGALAGLYAGMRTLDLPAPHFSERRTSTAPGGEP